MKFQRTNTPSTTVNQISEFEKETGFELPDDYKNFLLENNGGVPENTLFSIPDCSEEALIGYFLGINRPKEDLSFWLKEFHDDLPESFIPIAFDAGGNAILMDLEDTGTLYYWDYGRHFQQSTDDDNTFWIANSFTDLLNDLKKY